MAQPQHAKANLKKPICYNRDMKTYYCGKCGTEREIENWGRYDIESYCYCTADTPTMMSPISFKKMKDYSKVLKHIAKITNNQ